jgi:hypothetical protein
MPSCVNHVSGILCKLSFAKHTLALALVNNSGPFGGAVYVPRSWIDRDRALQKAVLEMDWLRVDEDR